MKDLERLAEVAVFMRNKLFSDDVFEFRECLLALRGMSDTTITFLESAGKNKDTNEINTGADVYAISAVELVRSLRLLVRPEVTSNAAKLTAA